MTQPHPQPKLEYIITEEMLQQWRVGCIYPSASIQFDDQKCCTCKYAGEGFRLHCCDFDDDSMEKIFRSRPHTPAAPATEYTIEQIAEIDNRIRKERKAEREKVLLKYQNWVAKEAKMALNGETRALVVRLNSKLIKEIESLRGGGAP